MKIIDEKGRLFGRINVIDFMTILISLLFIPIFYFGYRLKNSTPVKDTAKEYVEIQKDVKFVKIAPDILKLIQLGDKELNSEGASIGEIVWLGESRPHQYKFDIGTEEYFLKEDSMLKEVPARLKLLVEAKSNLLIYKDKQIMVDNPIEFKTEKYALAAIPTATLEERKSVSLNVNAILRDLDDDKVKLVLVGDKEINADRQVIAEVLKVGKVENSAYEINLGGGNIMLAEDNSKKQVFVKLRLNCEISKSGRLYFKNQEIRYGSYFDLKTDKYYARVVLSNVLVNERWVEVKIRFSGIIPELAKALTEGDVENDPLGRIMGRLKVIVSNKPSESTVLSLEQNKFVTVPQPFYRDITCILDILCLEKDGILYFKNYPIKIGNMITFTTDNYSIQGFIIGM